MGRCLNTLIMCDILKVRKPDHPTCLGLEQRGSLSTWWACMTHIVYIIQVSVRTLIKIARFAIFSLQIIFFRSYMLHIWFKGLFVWKPSTPLTFSCHVRSFTFIFISFLTPEIYLCIWKTPDRLSCRRDLWGYYADLPHEEINSGQEIQCRHRSLLLANVSFDGSCLLNALVKSRRRFLRMITLIILSLTQLSGKNRCY